MSIASQIIGFVGRIAKDVARQQLARVGRRHSSASGRQDDGLRSQPRRNNRPPSRGTREAPEGLRTYPGDHTGPITVTYAPHAGDLADPGEVVWTWVPYEEDHSQGKDRPVLIISRQGDWLLGLALSSKDHSLDREQEAEEGRHWVEIGTGEWDTRGKTSYVRVNRVVLVDPRGVRRIGGRLERDRFDVVAQAVREHYGW